MQMVQHAQKSKSFPLRDWRTMEDTLQADIRVIDNIMIMKRRAVSRISMYHIQ